MAASFRSMRLRRRPLSAIHRLALLVALAGLVVMHGFDAGAVTAGGDGGLMTATMGHDVAMRAGLAHSSSAMPDPAGSDRSGAARGPHHAEASGPAASPHAGLGHVVAMCVAVVVAATTALRRLERGALVRFRGVAVLLAGRLVRAVEARRPSGPRPLELCILLC